MNQNTPKQTVLADAVQSTFKPAHAVENQVARRVSRKQSPRPSYKAKPKKRQSAGAQIFIKTHIAMQAISDAVCRGQTYYVSGVTSVEKLPNALSVFDLKYGAFADRNERARRKRSGVGNVTAVLLFDSKNNKVDWLLLTTPPKVARHTIHETDKLKDSLTSGQRIEINGFELVRLTKKGIEKPRWTWRMTKSIFQVWRDYVIVTVRSRSHHRMENMLYQLASSPGFGGIRDQAKDLIKLYKAEVKRAGVKEAPQSRIPRYNRRIRHDAVTVQQLRAQIKATSNPVPALAQDTDAISSVR